MTDASSQRTRRLSRSDWAVAEEMYRQGSTQAQIADKFGIRVETVSRHMTKEGVKGGEKVDIVRREAELAVARKKREFAERVADRKIRAKDDIYNLTQTTLALFAKEVKAVKDKSDPMGVLLPAAKTMKDALAGIGQAWDQFVKVLDIKPNEDNPEQVPEIVVRGMTADEERALREQQRAIEDADVDEGIDSLAKGEEATG